MDVACILSEAVKATRGGGDHHLEALGVGGCARLSAMMDDRADDGKKVANNKTGSGG